MEAKLAVREKIIWGILVLLLVSGGVWRFAHVYQSPEPAVIQVNNSENDQQQNEEVEPALISVHLVGEVKRPGVYQLSEGSRVYEVLELGGGFTENAARDTLNQARPLLDGEQIFVHKIGEVPRVPTNNSSEMININRASASELTALPGIGEVRARQIVEHREKHGLFQAKEEIMEITGIGQATYDNFAEMITIY